ncbi:MAG: autotransporter outer membrane beta-barrel domain-containing protein [Spirochaetaceae bacterium]|nr:autotransporter outer membrane beta-barrel domain-containing protein [Myxococcales bacterium]MCB9722506.1 autotransporter outer membrane beta-barrel domain-containing protein [Spirochaetaceae bacterium]
MIPPPLRPPAPHRRRGLLATLAVLLVCVSLAERVEAACTPDPPADDDVVVCSGTDSSGYDASGATGVTITTVGVTTLGDGDPGLDSAVVISDDNTVTLGPDATISVTDPGGFGLRGGDRNTISLDGALDVSAAATGATGIAVGNDNDVTLGLDAIVTLDADDAIGVLAGNDNIVQNLGRIVVNGDDGRAISIGRNTGLPLPNGASSTGEIVLDGLRGYGIQSDDDSGVLIGGTVEVNGDGGRALSAGNKTATTNDANITNVGRITVAADDAYGLKVGDGWIDDFIGDHDGNPFTPVQQILLPGTRNLANGSDPGAIDVTGDRSFGIFAGDESNPNGDHDSFVANTGAIDVTGTDSIAISVGGNSRFDPFELGGVDLRPGLVTLNNDGMITGGADAGPLIEIRDFVAGHENRILNDENGLISADVTNRGTPGRGIAISGSAGEDLVVNLGSIEGDVDLDAGNDRYVHHEGASFVGRLEGGAGDDELTLGRQSAGIETFDLSQVSGFERLRVNGANGGADPIGWMLSNGDAFLGLTEVVNGGRLDVPTPLTLGGDLIVRRRGILALTSDQTTPALTVRGDARLGGTLELRFTPSVTPSPTPFRIIEVMGARTRTFRNEIMPFGGTFALSTIYDASGVLVLFEAAGFEGVARGANQRAIARHIAAIELDGTSAGDLQSAVDEWATSGMGVLSNVYQALSPEPYDAQTTLLVEGGRRVAGLLFDRPRECRDGDVDRWAGVQAPLPCHARRWSPWLAAVGSFRSRDGFSGHPRYDAQLGGLVFGVDARPLAGLDLTFAISSQRGRINAALAGDSTLTLADLTAQGAYSAGPLRVQAAVGWGHGFHATRRRIDFAETPTAIDVTGDVDYDSDRVLVAGEAGWLLPLGPIDVEPLVGFDWTWVFQRAVRESHAGGFGARLDDREDEVGSLTAGLRLSTTYRHQRYLIESLEWMDGVWRPSLDLRFRQLVAGDRRDLTGRFVGSADTVPKYTIQGEEDAQGAELGLGVSFVPENANRLQIDLRYEAFVAPHTLDQNLVARVALGF